SARLVTNAARVVVDETRRSFAYLSLYGVATDALLVNRLLPEPARGGRFARWAAREREELAANEGSFPIPCLRARLHPRERIGAEALRALAAELYGERDPAALLRRGRPLRWRRVGTETVLEIDLPGARKEELEVAVHGGDLLVRVRDAARRIALPELGGRPAARLRRAAGGAARGPLGHGPGGAAVTRAAPEPARAEPRPALAAPPARIVCLVPSITESLFALGLGPRVVGVTDWCVHPKEALAGVPRVGGTKD